MSRFSEKTCRIFWVFCVLTIFCFYQTTAAQSGRRPQKKNDSVEQTAPVESEQSNTETEIKETDAPVRISSLTVVGEVQHNFNYYKSNDVDIALKEFISFLKFSSKSVPQLTKGGKMNYSEAKEQAKKETDIFILWLGFSAKDDGYGNMYIDSVQYAVIKPKTAKVLTRGQIEPGQTGVGNPGGVLQVPTVRRRTSALSEMKNGARQIAAILLRGGWLD